LNQYRSKIDYTRPMSLSFIIYSFIIWSVEHATKPYVVRNPKWQPENTTHFSSGEWPIKSHAAVSTGSQKKALAFSHKKLLAFSCTKESEFGHHSSRHPPRLWTLRASSCCSTCDRQKMHENVMKKCMKMHETQKSCAQHMSRACIFLRVLFERRVPFIQKIDHH
jgi:hypothetical protein